MSKNRLEKLPRKSTIARHFAAGKYIDYPGEVIFSAVNSCALDYNPTAIPIKLGFRHYFHGNTEAFKYLMNHNSPSEIQAFLRDPNAYMENAGVPLALPFDDISPRIFAALVEEDILEILTNCNDMEYIFEVVRRRSDVKWASRHPERYPAEYMNRQLPYGLQDIPYSIKDLLNEKNGFSSHISFFILIISHFFCGEYDY